MGKLTDFEAHILDNYLTEYPEQYTFKEIMYFIINNDSQITIWEPFEDWDRNYLYRHILSLSRFSLTRQ